MTKTPSPRTLRLREGVVQQALRRTSASGEMSLPAAPAMVDAYARLLAGVFAALGRTFDAADLAHLRQVLLERLEAAYTQSTHGRVVVHYDTDDRKGVVYDIHAADGSLEAAYERWVASRDAPYFGAHPDAKVMDVAQALSAPKGSACLDVGAGSGRNAVPLARAGFAVDAIEPAPALADLLEKAKDEEDLPVRVVRANVLDESVSLEAGSYLLAVLSQVTSHLRNAKELRGVFERIAPAMAKGAAVVLNVFLARDGYTPDELERELSPTAWSTVFTRAELADAIAGLGLEVESDESAVEYEKARLPEWPPTKWFEAWAGGGDLFVADEDGIPVELRWVVLRRG